MSTNPRYPDAPKWAVRFFRWFCRPDIVEDIEGDLRERYHAVQLQQGPAKATRFLWWQVLLLFRPGIIRPMGQHLQLINTMMISHNLRLSWRLLNKNKGFALINIGGLATGMAIAMFIAIWITDELKYDRFHENGDLLFKVMRHVYSGNEIHTSDRVTYNIAARLKEDYAEVANVAVLSRPIELIAIQDDFSLRMQGYFGTPSFADMFSWRIIAGDGKSLLDDPSSMVISASLAKKYFGADRYASQDIVGRTLRHNLDGLAEFTIAGIFEDLPAQSSLQFDYLLPLEIYKSRNRWLTDWNNSGPHIFAQMHDGADWQHVSEDMVNMQNEHIEGFRSDLFLHPYPDQHLYGSFKSGVLQGGRIQYVRIFGLIGLMIILIACINFMNLATARSIWRIKEIGVRKTVGAGKRSLIVQFMSESVLLIAISYLLALSLVLLGLPFFNGLTGKMLSLADINPPTFVLFGLIGITTAVLAATYPSFYLSSLSVIRMFNKSAGSAGNKNSFRRGLVVFQFAMSFLLIVGTLVVYRQMSFIHQKNLGLDRAHVVTMPREAAWRDQYEAMKSQLQQHPSITQVSCASETPLDIGSNTHSVQWSGKDPQAEISIKILSVGYDFVETLRMQLAAGRSFDPALDNESDRYLINEEAAAVMGFDDPLGQHLKFWGGEGPIVGVVRDFHMSSFYRDIEPTILRLRPRNASDIFIRVAGEQTEEALAALEQVHTRFNPNIPFSYEFLDDQFAKKYESEQAIGLLSFWFTTFALLIAAMGLLGLAIFAGHQRLKEVSVRKILGATTWQVTYLLSRDFLLLIFVALLIASPIAYVFTENWLGNFSYRINLGMDLFVLAGLATMLISLTIVGLYALRIAFVNPIQALRSE